MYESIQGVKLDGVIAANLPGLCEVQQLLKLLFVYKSEFGPKSWPSLESVCCETLEECPSFAILRETC